MGYGPVPGGGGPSPSNMTPTADSGAGSPGVSDTYARGDHQHPASGGTSDQVLARIYVDGTTSGASGYPIFSSNPLTVKGPVLLAANTAQQGDVLEYDVAGTYTNGAAGAVQPVITFRLGIYTLSMCSNLPSLPPGTYGMRARGIFTVETVGASGKLMGAGWFEFVNETTGVVTAIRGTTATSVSPNFTINQAVEIVLNPEDASASMNFELAQVKYSPAP